MPHRRKLAVVMGTRPEAIKLAPVVLAADESGEFDVTIIRTSQHREMLDQMVQHFSLKVDVDLDIMQTDQSLSDITTAALSGLSQSLEKLAPDCVVVQGDTTTTFTGALAAFYLGIPVAHVEAGLRTYDRRQPFPEEANRCLTSQVTDFHFAPTQRSRENLIKEGIAPEKIWVTGNTAIDALLYTLRETAHKDPPKRGRRTLLLTAHRRENHGEGLVQICDAALELLETHPNLEIIYPLHLNPRVRETVLAKLAEHERIKLLEPLGYKDFILAMNRADLILTDSGGVQEEAPSLGKPVLILRDVTERPEASEAGVALAVGTNKQRIVAEASRLLKDDEHYRAMSQAKSPFGDGNAAAHIIGTLATHLGSRNSPRVPPSSTTR